MVSAKARTTFETQMFLRVGEGAEDHRQFGRGEVVFAQGDACEDVMYIQTGGVKLSVMSKTGREAVVAMLGPGDFFGEGCLAGQPIRMGSATAITPSAILLIEKAGMVGCCTSSGRCPTASSPTCWRATSGLKRT